jgi:DNA-binding MarR family transcriptional regulator
MDIQTKADNIGRIIDHLVDALGSEPACTLRRAAILADIDEHPGTNQAEIIERLQVNKSALNRDIEWLYDYGCVMRQPGVDGRTIKLFIAGYSKKNLGLALEYFDNDHKSLKNFIINFITLFGEHKPTLRDAKIIAAVGKNNESSRQDILESLYDGPSTTDNRSLNNLIENGIIEKYDEQTIL